MNTTALTIAAAVSTGTSAATASISPGSQRLVCAWVFSHCIAATPNTPTATGNSLTYVQVATVTIGGGPNYRFTVFRALGASPTAGAITFDFAGQSQDGITWTVVETTGVDTSGTDGSGAVVQSATGSGAGTTLLATLAAFSGATNGTLCGGLQIDNGVTFTAGSGFAIANQFAGAGAEGGALATEWRTDNDTTADLTSTSAQSWMAIAIEMKAAPEVPGGWSLYRPYTLGAVIGSVTSGLFYYWRRRKQEKPDE